MKALKLAVSAAAGLSHRLSQRRTFSLWRSARERGNYCLSMQLGRVDRRTHFSPCSALRPFLKLISGPLARLERWVALVSEDRPARLSAAVAPPGQERDLRHAC